MEDTSTVSLTLAQSEMLKKNPLLMLLSKKINGITQDWYPLDNMISINFSKADIKLFENKNSRLIVIEELIILERTTLNATNSILFGLKFRIASGYNVDDWKLIINDYIKRANNPTDRFSIMYLLWMLDQELDGTALLKALCSYPRESESFVIDTIQKISKILSLDKQYSIQSLFVKLGRNYNIHRPELIYQAVEKIMPYGNYNYIKINEWNTISLVDVLWIIYIRKKRRVISDNSDNPFVYLLYWLDNNVPLKDYSILENLFSYLPEAMKLFVIKRYLHDVRAGRTQFAPQLIERLKNNKYSNVAIYRECLSPNIRKDITIPLLLDSLLNVYNRSAIQTYNGVLDMAISNSYIYAPNVTVKWHCMFPYCKEAGLVAKKSFKGFVDCLYEGKFDEQKLNDEKEVRLYVDKLLSDIDKSDGKITLNKYNILSQIFLQPEVFQNLTTKDMQINVKDISYKTVTDNIRRMAEKVSTTSYMVELRNLKYIDNFFIANTERILIKPKISEDIYLDIYQYDASTEKYYYNKKEILKSKEDLNRSVICSLKKMLNQQYDGDYFELNGNDTNQLDLIFKLYYYNVDIKDNKNHNRFLYSFETNNLCCPKLADTCDTATGLPYYICNGKNCFHNTLQNQIIANELDWRKYTFFHLVEIIGCSMMSKYEAGYEPNEEVRRFIGLVRKAMKKYKVIQCKSCGHLIFPDKSSSNSYTYFACKNPDCIEYNKSYYINTCFNCGELIDARESAKCSNGRYICSSCLACCDDEQFERETANSVIRYKRISSYCQNLRGKGHNNKGIFYCPNCGMQVVKIEQNKYYCSRCKKTHSRIVKTWS